MSRYIDAEKLEARLNASPAFQNMGQDGFFLKEVVLNILDGQRTADVVEVGHGEWLMPLSDEPWRIGYFCRCSVCDKINNGHTLTVPNFCENCGAKMDCKRRTEDE